MRVTTHCLDETDALGQRIGKSFSNAMVIALTGDLGSGKTSLVQGIARGLDISDDYYITSPTYTLINEYPGRYPLFHVDLYRVEDSDDLENIGFDEILTYDAIVAVEWADKLPKNFLKGHLHVYFETLCDTCRKITITPYGSKAVEVIAKLKRMKEIKWD